MAKIAGITNFSKFYFKRQKAKKGFVKSANFAKIAKVTGFAFLSEKIE